MGPFIPALPESPLGEYSIRCLAKEASTDRRSSEATESLAFQEATTSINDWRNNGCLKRKKELDTLVLLSVS